MESGRIKPQIIQFNVSDLFERVKDEFASVAPEVSFEVNTVAGAGKVFNSDAEMIHQILTVLVSNSVKFSGGKCRVKLETAYDDAGRLVISESDDGPGIADETLPHIFDRFYRGDEAHSRSAGGSGLGLAIAKTLCGALGAEITAENVEPHGAKFLIRF